eukprot:3059649-Prymnesium_polylepis.2
MRRVLRAARFVRVLRVQSYTAHRHLSTSAHPDADGSRSLSTPRHCPRATAPAVDDLLEGKGAESVDISLVTLVFVSSGYFTSPNCMRELLRAVALRKPMFSLLEPEERRGGLTAEQVWQQLESNDESGFYDKCSLAVEVKEW